MALRMARDDAKLSHQVEANATEVVRALPSVAAALAPAAEGDVDTRHHNEIELGDDDSDDDLDDDYEIDELEWR
jgi:hypothetical protein